MEARGSLPWGDLAEGRGDWNGSTRRQTHEADVAIVPLPEEHEVIQAPLAGALGEPLRVRVPVRRLGSHPLHLDALRLKDLVEVPGERAVVVAEQVRRPLAGFAQDERQVPRLLLHPGR